MTHKPNRAAPSLIDELTTLRHKRGALKALAQQTPSTSDQGYEGSHLSHAHLSRILDPLGDKTLSGDLALRLEAALGSERGAYVETRAELIRRALADPRVVDLLWDHLRSSGYGDLKVTG